MFNKKRSNWKSLSVSHFIAIKQNAVFYSQQIRRRFNISPAGFWAGEGNQALYVSFKLTGGRSSLRSCRLQVCLGSGLDVFYRWTHLWIQTVRFLVLNPQTVWGPSSQFYPPSYIRVLTQRSHPCWCGEAGHLRQSEREAGDFGKRNAR